MSVTTVHLLRTYWAHWGAHSGISQFVKYIDPDRYALREQLVVDGNRNYRLLTRAARPFLSRIAMPWYKPTDLWGEIRALPRAFKGTHVLHYLDADTTACFLPQLKALGGIRTKVVASYHQPPDVLARIVPDRVLRCLDRVIVVSPEQAAHFTNLIGPERVRLIPHGIDTTFFCPTATGRRDGPIRCLTVGFWLRDFKTLGEVAQQLEHRHDIEFHIVAPETDGLTGGGNVTIHRSVTDDRLRELYQAADLLFLPLLAATANNALLEGIASALPVISTRLPAVESYLDGAEAILVDRNEPAAFVSALCSLADDAARRQRMARSSRNRAEQLDWRWIAKQYEDVYAD